MTKVRFVSTAGHKDKAKKKDRPEGLSLLPEFPDDQKVMRAPSCS